MSEDNNTQITKSNKRYIALALVVILAAVGILVNNNTKQTSAEPATIASAEQEQVIEKPVTARIDISTPLVNADEPQFEVYVDESETSEKQIDWMYKMNRQGYVIQKTDQEMNISIKALNNIEISIELRGPDVRDENGKIIENWVKYNSVTINGEEILNAPVVTWHSKPVVAYIISAKANNEYKIHVAWTKTDM